MAHQFYIVRTPGTIMADSGTHTIGKILFDYHNRQHPVFSLKDTFRSLQHRITVETVDKDINILFLDYLISFTHFLFCRRESHILASMIIFQNTDAHALVGGDFPELRNINIILIFHADRLLGRFIIGVVHYNNRYLGFIQPTNSFVTQTPSLITPELYTDL